MMPSALTLPFLNRIAALARLTSAALIGAIWQGALLAAVGALVLRLIPRIPAAARFAIWFAVFALIAALPFLGHAPHPATQPAAPAAARAGLLLDGRWTLAIAALWAAASLLRAATLVAAALRVRTLSQRATPLDLPTAIGPNSSRRVHLCSSTHVDRPTVIGFFSPKILIPAWLLEELTPDQLHHVILHEAGHLNRADDWLNLLQKIALVLFPLNPALAWVERRLCFERELACDERVLNALAGGTGAHDRAATGYAASLATLAEYRLQRRGIVRNLALALGALGSSNAAPHSELGRRIARILSPIRAMRPLHVRLATACAVVALLFSAAELERCPQVVSFAPASFASPVTSTQLANAASAPATDPGAPSYAQRRVGSVVDSNYRAVAVRMTMPGAPSIRALRGRVGSSDKTGFRAVATRQPLGRPQPEVPAASLIVTRYTVAAWPTANGYRIVRTTAVYTTGQEPTDAGAPSKLRLGGVEAQRSDSEAPFARTSRFQQSTQPYAAVPVPGGWLVFQL